MTKKQVAEYVRNFKYPPSVIKNGRLNITDCELLEMFKGYFDRLCSCLNPLYREDTYQELRFVALKCLRQSNGNLRPDIVIWRIKHRFDRFVKRERNRGMTAGPDNYDESELIDEFKRRHYDYRQVGNEVIFENRL